MSLNAPAPSRMASRNVRVRGGHRGGAVLFCQFADACERAGVDPLARLALDRHELFGSGFEQQVHFIALSGTPEPHGARVKGGLRERVHVLESQEVAEQAGVVEDRVYVVHAGRHSFEMASGIEAIAFERLLEDVKPLR